MKLILTFDAGNYFRIFFQIKTAYNFKTTGSAFDAVLHDDNILVGAMI